MRVSKPRAISKAVISRFWRRFVRIHRPLLTRHVEMTIVSLSKNRQGLVRRFRERPLFNAYVQSLRRLNELGKKTRFDSFDFVSNEPLKIDSKRGCVLERVWNAPSIHQLFHPKTGDPLFGSLPQQWATAFEGQMQKQGVLKHEYLSALSDAFLELSKKLRSQIAFELHASNVLVLVFNPKNQRPLLLTIDPVSLVN